MSHSLEPICTWVWYFEYNTWVLIANPKVSTERTNIPNSIFLQHGGEVLNGRKFDFWLRRTIHQDTKALCFVFCFHLFQRDFKNVLMRFLWSSLKSKTVQNRPVASFHCWRRIWTQLSDETRRCDLWSYRWVYSNGTDCHFFILIWTKKELILLCLVFCVFMYFWTVQSWFASAAGPLSCYRFLLEVLYIYSLSNICVNRL